MVLYWGGTAESSKGFMIHGASGMSSDKMVAYIQWDRTVTTAQSVKILTGKFSSTYLGTTGQASTSDTKKWTHFKELTQRPLPTELVILPPVNLGA